MTLEKRAKQNGKGYEKCTYFWRAIQKYGWENFESSILESDLTGEEAKNREEFYICSYDSTNREKGYNLKEKDSNVYSEETRKKLSRSMTGMHHSKETREKLRQANLGKKLPEEVKKKIGISNRGRKMSEYNKKKLREANLGRKLSKEHKKKLSEAKIGKYRGENSPHWGKHLSEERKQRLREVNTGKHMTTKTKEKISKTLKGTTPWNKGKKMSEEFCRKSSENHKGTKSATRREIVCVETGIRYYSITYASECTGIGTGNISWALKSNLHNTAGGFHWRYVTNDEKLAERSNDSSLKTREVMCIETGEIVTSYKVLMKRWKKSSSTTRSIISKNGLDPKGHHWKYLGEGKKVNRETMKTNSMLVKCVETGKIYRTLVEAGRDTGCNPQTISQVCKKVRGYKSTGGYHWEFIEVTSAEEQVKYGKVGNRQPVRCIETGVAFDSIKAAMKSMNLSSGIEAGIVNVCKGRSHTAGGYHWEYVNKDN